MYLACSCFDSWPDKKISVLWHFLTPSPLLNIKAPGLLNKLICGHYWVISTGSGVCVCVSHLVFESAGPSSVPDSGSLQQHCFRLEIKARRVCAHNTHTYRYDWHTITYSLNLKSWFYSALNSVVSSPHYTWNMRKMPGEIVWMCHGGDRADYTCSMHFLTFFFVRFLCSFLRYLPVSA